MVNFKTLVINFCSFFFSIFTKLKRQTVQGTNQNSPFLRHLSRLSCPGYPGYQRFFLACGGQKYFALHRRLKAAGTCTSRRLDRQRKLRKKNFWHPGCTQACFSLRSAKDIWIFRLVLRTIYFFCSLCKKKGKKSLLFPLFSSNVKFFTVLTEMTWEVPHGMPRPMAGETGSGLSTKTKQLCCSDAAAALNHHGERTNFNSLTFADCGGVQI